MDLYLRGCVYWGGLYSGCYGGCIFGGGLIYVWGSRINRILRYIKILILASLCESYFTFCNDETRDKTTTKQTVINRTFDYNGSISKHVTGVYPVSKVICMSLSANNAMCSLENLKLDADAFLETLWKFFTYRPLAMNLIEEAAEMYQVHVVTPLVPNQTRWTAHETACKSVIKGFNQILAALNRNRNRSL